MNYICRISRVLLILMLNFFILFLVSDNASSQDKSSDQKVTITDALGRNVEVPCPPKRIIAFFPFVAEIISSFGEMDRIVGRSMNCIFPPSILNKEDIGRPTEPDMEKILELNPDVVVCCARHTKKEVMDKISGFGIPVVGFEYNRFDHVMQAIESMGLMLNKEDKAKELSRWIKSYLNMIRKKTGKLKQEEKVRVYIEHGAGVYKSVSRLYGFHDLIEWAGGINIAADESVSLPIVNPEWVLEQNPDFIVIYGHPPTVRVDIIPSAKHLSLCVKEMLERPELKHTKAIKQGKVCLLHVRIITGPRMVIGLCYLAKWFYPHLFKDLDPEAVNREFFIRFWGKPPEGELVVPPNYFK